MVSNNFVSSDRIPRRVSFDDIGAFQALVGDLNKNIKHIEKSLDVDISIKGNSVSILGDPGRDEIAEKLGEMGI